MNKAERKKLLIQTIAKAGKIQVSRLIAESPFSRATVQRDLSELENGNFIQRTYGQVKYIERTNDSFFTMYNENEISNLAEKIKIGQKAQEFIRNDDIIFLTHGTTSAQVLRNINPQKNFTIVTDGLDIAMGAWKQKNILTCLLGGICNYETKQIEYSQFVSMQLKLLNPRCLITGVGGISIDTGATFRDYKSFTILKEVIKKAEEIIVVADSTKIAKTSLASAIPLERITRIITDNNADSKQLNQFRDFGIECLTV